MTKKVDAGGDFSFGEKGGKVQRIIEGEVKVKLFGVGKLIEKFVVADIGKSYNEAAKFTQKWIDDGNLDKE